MSSSTKLLLPFDPIRPGVLPASLGHEGSKLRSVCPVLKALTKDRTIRGMELELIKHMSRGEARRVIREAKEQAFLAGLTL